MIQHFESIFLHFINMKNYISKLFMQYKSLCLSDAINTFDLLHMRRE